MKQPSYEEVTELIKENLFHVKHIIIVGSGKGGVGKSTVSANLAYTLAMDGNSVGILDADLNGPSLGKMTGIEGERVGPSINEKIQPIKKNGVKIISMSSFIDNPDNPVIWRGPMKGSVIRQFLGEVEWGELDYLVIDLPPGTGDEALTVAQSIPRADGIVIVTTPQDVALLDSRKAINFAKSLNLPVIGIIENMSGFICPKCGEKIDLFKTGGGLKASNEFKIDFLGSIPIDIRIMETCDAGESFIFKYGKSENGQAFFNIMKKIIEKLEIKFSKS